MNKSGPSLAGVLLALGIAFGAGLYAGVSVWEGYRATAAAEPLLEEQRPDLSQFWAAWDLLEEHFVQTHASSSIPTREEKVWGAINGLTGSYGDPYTVFLPPTDAKIFQEDISGSFGGVGMELGIRGGTITVIAPLKGTPAEAAGIRQGDILLSINGTSTEGLAVDQAVKMIRGPRGTTVELRLMREGADAPMSVSIVRDTISIPVLDAYRRDDGIFVIELYSFSQNSPGLFRLALRKFFESGASALLLDLRGNPGGYLEAAVDMASFFLPVGEVVVAEDFKGRQPSLIHRSAGYNVFAGRGLKMAILVDGGSASASEILAGALAGHGVAKLVGERTFGKGTVQQLLDLGGGAQLKVTVARWLTPDGRSISDGGLVPDIAAERTQDDRAEGIDPQRDAAVRWLLGQ